MFRTIVLAVLFVEIVLPIILYLFGLCSEDSGGLGCLIFAVLIAFVCIIL